MTLGQNTPSAVALSSFVERIERIRADKKQLGEDEALVIAEAKSQGFVPAAIKHVIKLRGMKPSQREEAESIVDSYLHALGMAPDTPLFRSVGMMAVDTASREQVIEALKRLVPDSGSIIVDAGGKPVRLVRGDDGQVTVTDWVEPAPAPRAQPAPNGGGQRPNREPPPDVDGEGAERLGGEAFRGDKPIISNPFPFGDDRRPRWDAGWRKASGTDGMGRED
jgi:uncharacterized protein (UPF0335 family)